MVLKDFLMMRHELLLVLAAMIILIAEIAWKNEKRCTIKIISISLFFMITVLGFLPIETGSLFGGMYHTTGLIILFKNILNLGVLIIFIQSSQWLKSDENFDKTSEFFILTISTLIGMDFMISSGDFLMFYIGLELATIPMAALAALELYKIKSGEAGIKLILSSALSSGILLYGLSMIYGTTGSIYFTDVAMAFTNTNLQILAFIFFFAGMAFKISLVPFHLWTADVYEGAPINITSYLSVISKGAAAFILTLLLYNVFHSIVHVWQNLIFVISALTMTIGNLFAIRQTNIKRFLAFSSIAQAGFILLGIIGNNQFGISSVIYFILIYIFYPGL